VGRSRFPLNAFCALWGRLEDGKGKQVEARKSVQLHQLPNVFIFRLQRFQHDGTSECRACSASIVVLSVFCLQHVQHDATSERKGMRSLNCCSVDQSVNLLCPEHGSPPPAQPLNTPPGWFSIVFVALGMPILGGLAVRGGRDSCCCAEVVAELHACTFQARPVSREITRRLALTKGSHCPVSPLLAASDLEAALLCVDVCH
jgi:hypothetical protein